MDDVKITPSEGKILRYVEEKGGITFNEALAFYSDKKNLVAKFARLEALGFLKKVDDRWVKKDGFA